MDTREIERAIAQHPCAAAIFSGVYARDQLPQVVKYPCAMVLNTDPVNKPREHWVAVYITEDGKGEYTDSFGLPPPPCFNRFMERHCVQWKWNQIQLQDVWTSACGHFCVYYIVHRSCSISMTDITKHLNKINNNDQYVMELVNVLL